jgi:hypothetical protein
VKTAELLVQVRCLHCRHKSVLSNEDLARFGIKPGCSACGKGSVMVNRNARHEHAARRKRA